MGFNSGFEGLNGLVRFAERRNVVSARVRLNFKHSLPMAIFHSTPCFALHIRPLNYRMNTITS